MPLRKRIALTKSCFFEEPALCGKAAGGAEATIAAKEVTTTKGCNFQPKNGSRKRNFRQ